MSVDVSDKLYTLPGIMAFASGLCVSVPLTKWPISGVMFGRSELPPPLSSFFKLKPRKAPNLKVCAPFTQERSSRKLYRSCLFDQGAIIWVALIPPRAKFGMPIEWLFRSAGNNDGKSAVRVFANPALVPPAVMLIRL